MAIRGLLFDKDGTLLDFRSTYSPATSRVIDTLSSGDSALRNSLATILGFDLSSGNFLEDSVVIAGNSRDIAALCSEVMIDSPSLEHIDYLYHSFAVAHPFDFLVPTLESLRSRNFVLGVSTNDSESGAESHLSEVGIRDFFVSVMGHDSGFGAKPGPGMVLAFSQQTGIPVDSIAMIGDTMHDIASGKAAGSVTIAVGNDKNASSAADYALPSIRELIDFPPLESTRR